MEQGQVIDRFKSFKKSQHTEYFLVENRLQKPA